MNAPMVIAAAFGVLLVQRLLELRLSKRNELWLRERGAVEHGASHYPLFFVLHTGWLVGWPLEAWLRGPMLAPGFFGWLAAFVAMQGLRYWAIAALGERWNTRILALPDAPLVTRGPYRWLRHPNYVAVIVELFVVPMMFGAWITAAVATALNLVLLLAIRIPTETRALLTHAGDRRS